MCFYCRPNCLNHLLEAAPLSSELVLGTVLSFCQIATTTCHQQHFKIIESKSMLQFYHLSFLSFPYPFNVSSSSCLIRVKALPLVGGRGYINPELCALRDPLSTQTEPFITRLATTRRQKPRWRRRREQRPGSTGSTRRRATRLTTLWELSGMLKRISNDQFKPLRNAHCQCIAIQMLCFIPCL